MLPSVPPATQARRVFERSLIAGLTQPAQVTSVGYNLRAPKGAADNVRERLSHQQRHLIERLDQAFASWPGPFTWVMPAKSTTPRWLTGMFTSIAVRVSAHPQVRELCQAWGKPLVSTSANLSGEAPCRTRQEVALHLADRVDFILPGEVGGASNPSQIRDVLTGELLRPA